MSLPKASFKTNPERTVNQTTVFLQYFFKTERREERQGGEGKGAGGEGEREREREREIYTGALS
jgi:hypothetical protein